MADIAGRLPPGQSLTQDFPVLSAGPTPHTALEQWSFQIGGAVAEPVSWTWEELQAMPAETFTVDIHCVTKWSKLDTGWAGVSMDTLLAGVETAADSLMTGAPDLRDPVTSLSGVSSRPQ